MRSTPLSAFVFQATVEPRVKKVTVNIRGNWFLFWGGFTLVLIKMKVLFLLLLLVELTLKNEQEASGV